MPITFPFPLAARMVPAAQFGMKNAQARNVGFSLKWDAMNNQQEEQEVGAVEAGGKFLSQKSTQALGFLKEKSPVWIPPRHLPWGRSEAWLFFKASE